MKQPLQKTINPQPAHPRRRRQRSLETLLLGPAVAVLALLITPAILRGKNLSAQADAQQTAKRAQPASTHDQSAPEVTAARPTPISPANQPPNPARVTWDRRGLEIEASNSSLDQILLQVAEHTGAKLEGLPQDQRIFGSYGPGPGCDVLSKLLDGSGYNVLMIGCGGGNAPLEIVLTARSPTTSPIAATNQKRSSSQDGGRLEPERPPDSPAQPPSPQTDQNPYNLGESPRDPQQFMQEILERQQKIDRQQQQPQNQTNNPPQ